ncbi:hypothetical protein CRC_00141 [Cylindrospermopsis raciborskii CS-505]|nr:hypothetical protein CRC_00141 [Cylindrospermopsis raciborskii CS-505]
MSPGGIGNKNGKTNKAMTRMNPRWEVVSSTSPKVRGWCARRCSKDFISSENVKRIVQGLGKRTGNDQI